MRDLRYALRQLVRAPFFTVAAAVSLGVGIAIAVVAYSFANALLFKRLPVPDADRVVHVYTVPQGAGRRPLSYPDLEDIRASGVFTSVAAFQATRATVAVDGRAPARVRVDVVSSDYVSTLGLRLDVGRDFAAGEAARVAILSTRFRDAWFGDDARVIGAELRVNGVPFVVAGVAPDGFRGANPFSYSGTAVWLPVAAVTGVMIDTDLLADRSRNWWHTIGRLPPGMTAEAAEARLTLTAGSLARDFDAWRDIGGAPVRVRVMTHHDAVRATVNDDLREVLVTAAAIVAVILLLGCTNVAGLLLARGVTRRHEIAVRFTLGASRAVVARQLVAEALLLSLLGGAVGFVVAQWGLALLARQPWAGSLHLTPDWRIFAAVLATCVACALAFGLTPIAYTLRTDVRAGLAGHGIVGERGNVRGRVVALQVALSALLIFLGVHASRGMRAELRALDGDAADGYLVAQLELSAFRGSEQMRAYVDAAESILRESADVQAVTLMRLPPAGPRSAMTPVTAPGARPVSASTATVRTDWFDTFGMRVLRGVVPRDVPQGRRLVVVNRALSDSMRVGLVGSTVRIGSGREFEVVAEVSNDVRDNGTALPAVYQLADDASLSLPDLVARVDPDAMQAVGMRLSAGLAARFPDRVPPRVTSLRDRVRADTAPFRYAADAVLGFGVLQLALAALGLYSLLLFATLTRTREVGIRMALGATSLTAALHVIRDGMHFILAGVAIGLVLCIPAALIAQARFRGATATDIVPFVLAFAGVGIVALAAAWVPIRRARAVQPMAALRHE